MSNYKYIAERRKLIGKKIEWEYAHDPYRGTCLVATGVVDAVEGKNMLIDDTWRWYPEMKNIRVIEEECDG